MIEDILNKVRDAEEEADGIRRAAEEEAAKIRSDADEAARLAFAEAKKNARAARESATTAAELVAEKEYLKVLSENESANLKERESFKEKTEFFAKEIEGRILGGDL